MEARSAFMTQLKLPAICASLAYRWYSPSGSGIRHNLSVSSIAGTTNAFPLNMQSHLSLLSYPQDQGIRARHARLDDDPSCGFHSLSLEVSIPADIRRLFHALTVPEYVETWMSVPGERPGCSTVAARTDDHYAIGHSCQGRPSVSISGSYRMCRRRNVVFSWRVDGELSVPETEVEIRLRGDFERTTLVLSHTGFAARRDFEWHSALWTTSMRRLASLYGSPNRTAM